MTKLQMEEMLIAYQAPCKNLSLTQILPIICEVHNMEHLTGKESYYHKLTWQALQRMKRRPRHPLWTSGSTGEKAGLWGNTLDAN